MQILSNLMDCQSPYTPEKTYQSNTQWSFREKQAILQRYLQWTTCSMNISSTLIDYTSQQQSNMERNAAQYTHYFVDMDSAKVTCEASYQNVTEISEFGT